MVGEGAEAKVIFAKRREEEQLKPFCWPTVESNSSALSVS